MVEGGLAGLEMGSEGTPRGDAGSWAGRGPGRGAGSRCGGDGGECGDLLGERALGSGWGEKGVLVGKQGGVRGEGALRGE